MEQKTNPNQYKSDLKPIWCPGCGDFAVLSSLTKSFAELELPTKDVAVISGIGCSSRLPAYLSTYGYHTIHGRALCVASGLKVARDDITVVAVGGDGDGFSIGGNHFIHTCRKNINMTYIVMDNSVYGMTKGQASPTTSPDWLGSKLTPHGSGVPAFQPMRMALASGASFVARAFSGNPKHLTEIITKGIQHKGFSFIHVVSPCVTWRPEQKEYKNFIKEGFGNGPTDDHKQARQNLLDDDGFRIGILYQTRSPILDKMGVEKCSIDKIGTQFSI